MRRPPPEVRRRLVCHWGILAIQDRIPRRLSDLAVAMLQEEHAEKDAIDMILDVATKEYLRMPLVGPVGPSQQVQLTGQGSWRTGKFKSCDDVAAASSIRDQHPKGGVSP